MEVIRVVVVLQQVLGYGVQQRGSPLRLGQLVVACHDGKNRVHPFAECAGKVFLRHHQRCGKAKADLCRTDVVTLVGQVACSDGGIVREEVRQVL